MLPTASPNETKVETPTTPAQEQPPAVTQPSYVTVEQLNQIKTELSQKIDQVYRGTQSRQDQFTAKVQKKLEAFENAAKATGIQLNDAQRKAAQDNAVFQVLSEEAPTAQSNGATGQLQPQGNAVSEEEPDDPVNTAARAMLKAWKVQIEATDPENALIVAAETGTAEQYLDATYQAIQAKLARVAQSSQVPTPTPQGIPRSPGVVKGTAQSNPIQNINDSEELFKMSKFAKRG